VTSSTGGAALPLIAICILLPRAAKSSSAKYSNVLAALPASLARLWPKPLVLGSGAGMKLMVRTMLPPGGTVPVEGKQGEGGEGRGTVLVYQG
jgi:hypothetical protein